MPTSPAVAPPFLTPVELALFPQAPTLDVPAATLLIAMASASVRDYCGWNITEETVTGQIVVPAGQLLFLPTLHLTALAVVESGATLIAGPDFTWTVAGVVERVYSCWSTVWQAIVANYTHGYAAAAPELLVVKQVIGSVVSRLAGDPEVLQSLTVGGVSETYAVSPQIPASLLYAERDALSSFALRVVA